MIEKTSSTYALIMPKVKLTPIKQKTKTEEVKEIIQNPNDPLAKYPLRAFGYSNEIGAAVSAMPVWGKTAEAALWVPALMYLGADIYDKFRRGKEGDYTEASATAAVEQAIFQALASVILPTAAVKMGQNIAGYTEKFGKYKLSATAQEELYTKLLRDFDRGKFAKSDYTDEKGVLRKGYENVLNKVLDTGFYDVRKKTVRDLKTESIGAKIVRFFGHTDRPVVSSRTERSVVENFLKDKTQKVFEIQKALESGDDTLISNLPNKKLVLKFNKQLLDVQKQTDELLKSDPGFMLKKLLNNNDEKLKHIKDAILKKYSNHIELKALVSSENLSKDMLEELMKSADDKRLINNFAKRVEATRIVMRKFLKGKAMKLGLLKTAGGFISLACLAVPIDHFVHKYIIKKFIGPGLENVQNFNAQQTFQGLQNKLTFK